MHDIVMCQIVALLGGLLLYMTVDKIDIGSRSNIQSKLQQQLVLSINLVPGLIPVTKEYA